MSQEASFESSWREVCPGLERALRARGIAPDLVDDVVQETSIRLLKAWDRLDHERPLGPLAHTIAFNCLVDMHRVASATPVEEVPDEPSCYDLEEHALARVRLTNAVVALGTLPSNDRSALLAEVGMGERGTTSGAKMARMRARKRLAAAMDRIAAAFGGIQLGWRRLASWLQELRPAGEASLPVMASVFSVAAAAVLGMSSDPSAFSDPGIHRIGHVETVKHEDAERNGRGKNRSGAGNSAKKRQQGHTMAARDTSDEPRPEPTPSETTVVDNENASVKTREGKNYKGVQACTGKGTADEKDDHSASMNVDLGEDDDPGSSC